MRDYLKFAFVRNPFDRFVSYCSFMTRQGGDFDRDPRGTMHRILFELRPLQHVHFQPQYTFLVDERGELATDFIGRVETMQESYDALCAKLGIPGRTLDKAHGSAPGDIDGRKQNQIHSCLACDIVGPVCETGDTFATGRQMDDVSAGDLVVFRTAGAYAAAMASTYNSRPLTPEVLVERSRWAVVRPRIDVDQLIAADRVPDWLGGCAEASSS